MTIIFFFYLSFFFCKRYNQTSEYSFTVWWCRLTTEMIVRFFPIIFILISCQKRQFYAEPSAWPLKCIETKFDRSFAKLNRDYICENIVETLEKKNGFDSLQKESSSIAIWPILCFICICNWSYSTLHILHGKGLSKFFFAWIIQIFFTFYCYFFVISFFLTFENSYKKKYLYTYVYRENN